MLLYIRNLSQIRRTIRAVAAATTVAAFTLVASAASGASSAAAAPSGASLYLVQVADAPVAAYTGGVAGLAATRPSAGHKIDPRSAAVRAYRGHLAARRAAVMRSAGVAASRSVYDYSTVFSGFAAQLTSVEAQKLRDTPGVVNVWKNRLVTSQTFTTPEFVGLDGKGGAWRKEFGDPRRAGEGVIIGVLDSGFWPENPSVGALPTPRPDQATIDAKWHGTCDPGVEAPVSCNNKVIGARWYNAGGLATANANEFSSPRDFFGHGSHTSSIAAGNYGVTATINGTLGGKISGMAPAARIAVYKVLYANAANTQSVGSTADIVAAINQAVEDGVDVINYSIGDDVDQFGPTEFAFLNAAAAGVFVAASAGNAGAGPQTVDNAVPWMTTVAAGTHDRSYAKKVTLGNGRSYTGVGVAPSAPRAPLVDSAGAGLPGADPTAVTQCVSGTNLDPAKVAGKVVLCARGGNTRVDKSLAVKQAGGVAMVLYNVTPNTLNQDYHHVPTVHVDEVAGAAIKAYAATAQPTATIGAGKQITVDAPLVTTFSSRGPSISSGGDLLKPDIMAPGLDVLAGVSPANGGNLWDLNSGTSMSSPHIAGIAALLVGEHPTWSPMAVKSALMTTASPLNNRHKPIGDQATAAAATPLDFGAGQVEADRAFDPGLVYDSGIVQWLQYSCGIGVHLQLGGGTDACDVVGTVDPSEYNSPSLAVGDLAGKQVLHRTVTNVSRLPGLYAPHISAPPGFTVTVSPKVLLVRSGATATFSVTITRTNAPIGQYAFGSLTWKDALGHQVRSPIAVRPVALASPAQASGTGTSGSTALSLISGYAGSLTAAASGLTAATVTPLALTTAPGGFDPDNPATSARTGSVDVTVPAGSKVARFATFAADYAPGTDLDLFVYARDSGGGLTLVGQSAGGTADESVTLTEPGEYVAFVDLFDVPGDGALTVRHHHWVVPPANAGNVTATPASQPVTVGAAVTVTVGWSGLGAGLRYLGVVEYGDGSQTLGSTLIAVNS